MMKLLALVAAVSYVALSTAGHAHSAIEGTVTYDSRSLLIDGERKLLISGSVHYPRSSEGEWRGIIQAAKEAGINTIETYTFWDIHETKEAGVYDFSGNYDFVRFISEVQRAGLYAIVRLGPYVCAEWTYGGLPVRLRRDPGIKFRSTNALWEEEVTTWLTYLVDKMKEAKMFYSQGGPVILTQIENEYGNMEGKDGAAGRDYVAWNAQLARDLDVPVPWIMCQQNDSPQDIISTCNGFYCHDWIEGHYKSHPNQPAFYTENWPGWFQQWGAPKPTRPIADVAYSVARWFAAGGTLNNYYMLQGGTNFGRTVATFLVTSYDYNVIIDEYGVPRQPDYNHLAALHSVLYDAASVLLNNPRALPVTVEGSTILSYVYGDLSSTECVAFLVNQDNDDATANFNGRSVMVPGWSVSILSNGCTDVVFNTADVPTDAVSVDTKFPVVQGLSWKKYQEPLVWTEPIPSKNAGENFPSEQIELTQDDSDYLTYLTTVERDAAGSAVLVIANNVDVNVFVVVNGKVASSKFFGGSNFTATIDLKAGRNEIALVCGMMGLGNYMQHFETYKAGLNGNVTLDGATIPASQWSHVVGLQGEALQVYSRKGSNNVAWRNIDESSIGESINPIASWYKSSSFDAPDMSEPLAVELVGMTKGSVWVNDHHLGRYWNIMAGHSSACYTCSYKGQYNADKKCRVNCDAPSQRYYHLPRDWLLPKDNFIVVLEEVGGLPNNVQIVRHVSEVLVRERLAIE